MTQKYLCTVAGIGFGLMVVICIGVCQGNPGPGKKDTASKLTTDVQSGTLPRLEGDMSITIISAQIISTEPVHNSHFPLKQWIVKLTVKDVIRKEQADIKTGDDVEILVGSVEQTFGVDADHIAGKTFSIIYMEPFETNYAGEIKVGDQHSAYIAAVMPEEYARYRIGLTGQNTMKDCRLGLSLVSDAMTALFESAKSTPERNIEYRRAYWAAWYLSLKIRKTTHDPNVAKMIFEEWDNQLKEENEAVPYQIFAIKSTFWERNLLTDNFWKLLERMQENKTLLAICAVLYENGNAEDLQRLRQKAERETSDELKDILYLAISHLKHRLSGEPGDSGPAAAPPRMTFKDIPPDRPHSDPNRIAEFYKNLLDPNHFGSNKGGI